MHRRVPNLPRRLWHVFRKGRQYPNPLLSFVLFALALILLAPPPPPDSLEAADLPAALALAIDAYTRPFESDGEARDMDIAWADLDGDGLQDALVSLHSPSWCTADGCTLLVFQAVPDEDVEELGRFTPAAEISRVWGSVRVLNAQTNGWADLAVGDETPLRLAFDGETYPSSAPDGLHYDGPLGAEALVVAGRH